MDQGLCPSTTTSHIPHRSARTWKYNGCCFQIVDTNNNPLRQYLGNEMRWMFGFKWYRDFNRRLVADFLYFRRLLLRRRLSLTSRDYVWTDHVGHFDGRIRALGHQGIVRVQRHPSQHLHMKRMADPVPVIDNKLPIPAEGDACKPCKHQGNHCNHCNHCNHNHPNDSGASRNVFTTSSLTQSQPSKIQGTKYGICIWMKSKRTISAFQMLGKRIQMVFLFS